MIQDHETCDVIAANVSHRRNAASLSKVGALNYIAAAYILGASAVSNNKIPRGGSDYIYHLGCFQVSPESCCHPESHHINQICHV